MTTVRTSSRANPGSRRTRKTNVWTNSTPVVTITTVGYGDFFPVTTLGRLTGVSVMFAGVGIIGALASILASLLVPPPKPPDDEEAPAVPAMPASAATATPAIGDQGSAAILAQLAELRAEVRALREAVRGEPVEPPPA